MIRKMTKLLLKSKTLHSFAFWLNGYYIAYEHRFRYPDNLHWHAIAPSPFAKLDSSWARIGHQWYTIGGYLSIDSVHSYVDVFDLKAQKWTQQFKLPYNMAQSHLAVTTDESRFIYAVSGQLGAQCSPAIREAFVYDSLKNKWESFPSLPEPRYAATMKLWQGRLHLMGGSLPDRYTPSTDHWSIAVRDGKALEKEWRKETPIPRGATHLSSAIINNELYVFGGQFGDFIPKPHSYCFECNGLVPEICFDEMHKLTTLDGQWDKLADMPIASSHMENAVIVDGSSMIILGGQIYKDPLTFQLKLTDVIQKYDASANQWTIVGHLPYSLKTTVAAYYEGWLYFTTGQKGVNANDPSPSMLTSRTWRTRITI